MTKSEAIKIAAKYDGELYDGYSGRGMYGEETTAVKLDRYAFCNFQKSKDAKKYRTDNLGLNFIIY